MDYKKIFRSRALRFRILRLMSFVPDSIMLRLQYRIKMGFWPDFRNPKRFTEKLQLYKMYYRHAAMPQCVDKYEVRGYLEERGFGRLLNTLYGVYDRAEDIDFSTLPDKFVIKTTNGAGGLNVLICKDKYSFDTKAAIKKLNSWIDKKKVSSGREWAYTGIKKSRIIVEEYLENEDNPEVGLEDFKFFCFDGKPAYCQIIGNRYADETIDFFDMDFNHLAGLVGLNEKTHNSLKPILRPGKWEQMVKDAASLSAGYPFVRVDLYNIRGRIVFGELTFYPASGYGHFSFDEFDYKLGELFNITSFSKISNS